MNRFTLAEWLELAVVSEPYDHGARRWDVEVRELYSGELSLECGISFEGQYIDTSYDPRRLDEEVLAPLIEARGERDVLAAALVAAGQPTKPTKRGPVSGYECVHCKAWAPVSLEESYELGAVSHASRCAYLLAQRHVC